MSNNAEREYGGFLNGWCVHRNLTILLWILCLFKWEHVWAFLYLGIPKMKDDKQRDGKMKPVIIYYH